MVLLPYWKRRRCYELKVLVTAGGTSERIDSVRKITNSATGRLGSLIAGEFDKRAGAALEKIYYVCERGCILPETPHADIIFVEGVLQLENAVRELMARETLDAVVHSMAVSDYMVDRVSTPEILSRAIADSILASPEPGLLSRARLEEIVCSALIREDCGLDATRKVSSELDRLQLHLKKTPKIIGLFKELQPETVLVGFKLLSGAPDRELLDAADRLMGRNRCDFVLANDLDSISGDRHAGCLLSGDGSIVRYGGKPEIAVGIVSAVLNKLGLERSPA